MNKKALNRFWSREENENCFSLRRSHSNFNQTISKSKCSHNLRTHAKKYAFSAESLFLHFAANSQTNITSKETELFILRNNRKSWKTHFHSHIIDISWKFDFSVSFLLVATLTLLRRRNWFWYVNFYVFLPKKKNKMLSNFCFLKRTKRKSNRTFFLMKILTGLLPLRIEITKNNRTKWKRGKNRNKKTEHKTQLNNTSND